MEPIIQHQIDGPLDPAQVVEAMLPAMHQAAKGAQALAEHYKNFKVGASVLALEKAAGGFVASITIGWNRKLKAGHCPDRRCAEMHALWSVIEKANQKVLAIVVHAPFQADDATGLNLGVLICCGYCRNDFRQLLGLQMAVDHDVLMVFHNIETNKTISMSLGEVLERCGGSNDPAIYQLGTPVMGLLQAAGRPR